MAVLRSRVTLCLWVRCDHRTDSVVDVMGNTLTRVSARVVPARFQLCRSLRRSVSIQTITPAAATCC